jgi:hypothetical protein
VEKGIGSAEDARGEKAQVGGRDLALAGGAGEDEVVAVDDGGPRTTATAGASPALASALPQSTATAVSVPSTAAGSWAAYLPEAVILPSTVPGSSVPLATVIVSRV